SAAGAGYQRTAKRNTVNACGGSIDGTPELKCAACSFGFIRRVGSMKRAAVSLSNARPRAAQRPIDQRLIAIIDLGSNSVRIVVYRGAVRVPPTIFNEMVMCGLAKGLAITGLMDADGMEQALYTLRRFSMLCADMQVDQMFVVATA